MPAEAVPPLAVLCPRCREPCGMPCIEARAVRGDDVALLPTKPHWERCFLAEGLTGCDCGYLPGEPTRPWSPLADARVVDEPGGGGRAAAEPAGQLALPLTAEAA